MKRFLAVLVLLFLAFTLPGCPAGGGRVRFIDCTGSRSFSVRAEGEDPPAPAEFEISQLNTVCGIEIRSVRADAGGTPVEIRPAGVYDCASITPEEGGLILSVEGLKGGTAEIETMDGTAALPVVVYNRCVKGIIGYTFAGFTVLPDGSHISTANRETAHFWSEWRAEYNGNDWKALVPAYIADPGTESLGANHERIAAVKTVDIERFADAPAEQWLEVNRIYVCKVPDGYVKVANTSRGVIWLFSPTPEFP